MHSPYSKLFYVTTFKFGELEKYLCIDVNFSSEFSLRLRAQSPGLLSIMQISSIGRLGKYFPNQD